MKRLIIAIITWLAVTGIAQAQDFKPYAGVGLGAFGLELKNASIAYNQKNTVFGGYLKFGADINDYFGGELRIGTTANGTSTYPRGTITLSGDYFLSYLAKIQYPLTPDFRLYGLLGGTTAKMKVSVVGPLVVSDSATQTGFSYGVGGEYFFNPNMSLGAEWMQYWTNVGMGAGFEGKIWGAVGTLNYAF